MTGSAEDAGADRESAIHPDWTITREDVRRWYARHPETFPGLDVAPIILNERRQAAADEVRAAYRDLPEVLVADQLKELSGCAKSMRAELVERIAAYLPLPMSEASSVPDMRLLPRRPGRPGWERPLFLERLQEAEDAAAQDPTARRRRLGGSPTLADIAAEFRVLDGTKGMNPDAFRRLRRHFMPKAPARSSARSARQ